MSVCALKLNGKINRHAREYSKSKMKENTKSTRIPIQRGPRLNVTVDGELVEAYAGETAAAVLMTAGHIMYQAAIENHPAKSLFCGMGVCFNCAVTINGIPNTRACSTLVTEGMRIETNWSDDE